VVKALARNDAERRVWRALEGVLDPEIPAVSVVEMGMIESVDVRDGRARVVLLPTFTGCPAVAVIEQDVSAAAAAVEGVREVDVARSFDPPWTTERITPRGRAKLRGFGLAPPAEGPVLIERIGLVERAICPFCSSEDTVAEGLFGPTPCRSVYYCRACRNPFERFKAV
jgi:ring-1,2-phenylacetyl-CoA epoxidase subunit PaaD